MAHVNETAGTARTSPTSPAADDAWFENPVLPGFHPDPSICRVGEDYYLVTSTFEYFPGLPVFTSRDLVSWRRIGHCLTRPEQLDLSTAPSSGGLFAPTIRWSDGRFYVTCTNVSGGGHFIVHATDPAGPWSDPVWVDQGGIDPSLFFDDDGAVYFTSTFEPPRPDLPVGVQQCRIDPLTGEKLTESRFLWEGTGGTFPEGPHLYRRGDHYYLLLAEGGTEYGHMVTVARSTTPWGPWEPAPHNPVLSHRSSPHPVQATGHADLVELPDGSWWMVCLGIRPTGHWPRHHLGRETFLVPVGWTDDGWPRIAGPGHVELRARRPRLPAEPLPVQPVRDDFDGPELGSEWITLRAPLGDAASLTEAPGRLTLHGGPATTDSLDLTFVGRRQQHHRCTIATRLEFEPTGRDEAGLTVRMNDRHHYDVGVRRGPAGREVVLRQRIGPLSVVVGARAVPPGDVELHVDAGEDLYRFAVRTTDGGTVELGTAEVRYLSSETAGGFTGVVVGLYATGDGAPASAPAAFDWFDYTPLPRG